MKVVWFLFIILNIWNYEVKDEYKHFSMCESQAPTRTTTHMGGGLWLTMLPYQS
jgi:hypothetical protein